MPIAVTARRVGADYPDTLRVRTLYESAFPPNERRPFDALLAGFDGQGELFAFYDGPRFAGFVSLLTWADITHILYFAIDDALRGRGLGSAALGAVRRMKPQNRLIADLEAQAPGIPNPDQRRRRKQFYLRNGFAQSAVRYRWQGETYEIVVCGGPLSQAEFVSFWRHFGVKPKEPD